MTDGALFGPLSMHGWYKVVDLVWKSASPSCQGSLPLTVLLRMDSCISSIETHLSVGRSRTFSREEVCFWT